MTPAQYSLNKDKHLQATARYSGSTGKLVIVHSGKYYTTRGFMKKYPIDVIEVTTLLPLKGENFDGTKRWMK